MLNTVIDGNLKTAIAINICPNYAPFVKTGQYFCFMTYTNTNIFWFVYDQNAEPIFLNCLKQMN